MTDQAATIVAVKSNGIDRTVRLKELHFVWTDIRSHVCPVQRLRFRVDYDSVNVLEQVPEQSAAITAIGIHLHDFAAWPVLSNVELSLSHSGLCKGTQSDENQALAARRSRPLSR